MDELQQAVNNLTEVFDDYTTVVRDQFNGDDLNEVTSRLQSALRTTLNAVVSAINDVQSQADDETLDDVSSADEATVDEPSTVDEPAAE